MSLSHTSYEDRNERIRDFVIGILIFFVGNTVIVGVLLLLLQAVTSRSANSDVGAYTVIASCCLPLFVNFALSVYFYLVRRWIALGMIVSLIASVVCGMFGYALLILSGFSLV